jgi:hypothetical protein
LGNGTVEFIPGHTQELTENVSICEFKKKKKIHMFGTEEYESIHQQVSPLM